MSLFSGLRGMDNTSLTFFSLYPLDPYRGSPATLALSDDRSLGQTKMAVGVPSRVHIACVLE